MSESLKLLPAFHCLKRKGFCICRLRRLALRKDPPGARLVAETANYRLKKIGPQSSFAKSVFVKWFIYNHLWIFLTAPES